MATRNYNLKKAAVGAKTGYPLSSALSNAYGKVTGALGDWASEFPAGAEYLLNKFSAGSAPAAAAPVDDALSVPGMIEADPTALMDPTSEQLAYQKTFDSLISDLTATSKSMMAGELPADMQESVINASIEAGTVAGLGETGTAVRSLTMRDLGKVSYDLMLQGSNIALSTADLVSNANKNAQDARAQTIQLINQTNTVTLTEAQLAEQKRESVASHNLAVAQTVISVAEFGMELGFRYSSTPQKGTDTPESVSSDVTNILADLQKLYI